VDDNAVVVANDEDGVDDVTVLTAVVVEETKNICTSSWVKNNKGDTHFISCQKKWLYLTFSSGSLMEQTVHTKGRNTSVLACPRGGGGRRGQLVMRMYMYTYVREVTNDHAMIERLRLFIIKIYCTAKTQYRKFITNTPRLRSLSPNFHIHLSASD
jgi:hypothetical protein